MKNKELINEKLKLLDIIEDMKHIADFYEQEIDEATELIDRIEKQIGGIK